MNETSSQLVKVTLVRLDETEHYTPKFFEDHPLVAKVFGTYIFDRTERTFCCEATPSYFLRYLRSDPEWTEDPDEEERGSADITLIEAEEDSDHYRHCRDVERYIADHKDQSYVDTFEYETMDEAIEEHQGNHVL